MAAMSTSQHDDVGTIRSDVKLTNAVCSFFCFPGSMFRSYKVLVLLHAIFQVFVELFQWSLIYCCYAIKLSHMMTEIQFPLTC